MEQLKFGVNIQTLKELRDGGFYYIDKTPEVLKLAQRESRRSIFLSRPRRFGKTLLLDTMNELFIGSKELFEGLYIYDKWDWDESYPVIRIDFGKDSISSQEDYFTKLYYDFSEFAKIYNVQYNKEVDYNSPHIFLGQLLKNIFKKLGKQVVVLIDEYDKPLLDSIENIELHEWLKVKLKALYTNLKGYSSIIRFAFLTGVTKFAGVSLFSGFNIVNDISLDPEFATICGFTEKEVLDIFKAELEGKDFKEIKRYYNGYCFGGEKVFNPIDLALHLESGEYKDYWIETGQTGFLFYAMKKRNLLPEAWDIDDFNLDLFSLNNFDMKVASIPALLYQAGYLTLKNPEELKTETVLTLDFPNQEVKNAYYANFLLYICPIINRRVQQRKFSNRMNEYLQTRDFAGIESELKLLIENIPYEWTYHGNFENYEGYFCAIFFTYLFALGRDTVEKEPSIRRGRPDIVVRTDTDRYIIEVKIIRSATDAGSAMRQLHERNYAAAYDDPDIELHLIGIEVDGDNGDLLDFTFETVAK